MAKYDEIMARCSAYGAVHVKGLVALIAFLLLAVFSLIVERWYRMSLIDGFQGGRGTGMRLGSPGVNSGSQT